MCIIGEEGSLIFLYNQEKKEKEKDTHYGHCLVDVISFFFSLLDQNVFSCERSSNFFEVVLFICFESLM